MSDSTPGQPMEEILASIKRIIAEDAPLSLGPPTLGAGGRQPANEDVLDLGKPKLGPIMPEPYNPNEEISFEAFAPQKPAAPVAGQPTYFRGELVKPAEAAADYVQAPRALAPTEEEPVPAPVIPSPIAREPEPEYEPEIEHEPDAVYEPEPLPTPTPVAMHVEPEPAPAAAAIVAEPAPEPVHPPEPEAMADAEPKSATPDAPATAKAKPAYGGLISPTAEAASRQAFAALSALTVEPEAESNTLDGLVREMLRPMIKEWLDSNLPAIVEEMVEKEIKRLGRG